MVKPLMRNEGPSVKALLEPPGRTIYRNSLEKWGFREARGSPRSFPAGLCKKGPAGADRSRVGCLGSAAQDVARPQAPLDLEFEARSHDRVVHGQVSLPATARQDREFEKA